MQISSACVAIFGNRSQNSRPDCPNFANVRGDGRMRAESFWMKAKPGFLQKRLRHRLAGELIDLRLGVEQIELGRSAGEKKEDAILRARLEVRRLRR